MIWFFVYYTEMTKKQGTEGGGGVAVSLSVNVGQAG